MQIEPKKISFSLLTLLFFLGYFFRSFIIKKKLYSVAKDELNKYLGNVGNFSSDFQEIIQGLGEFKNFINARKSPVLDRSTLGTFGDYPLSFPEPVLFKKPALLSLPEVLARIENWMVSNPFPYSLCKNHYNKIWKLLEELNRSNLKNPFGSFDYDNYFTTLSPKLKEDEETIKKGLEEFRHILNTICILHIPWRIFKAYLSERKELYDSLERYFKPHCTWESLRLFKPIRPPSNDS